MRNVRLLLNSVVCKSIEMRLFFHLPKNPIISLRRERENQVVILKKEDGDGDEMEPFQMK